MPVGGFVVSVHMFYFYRHNDPITITVGDDDKGAMYARLAIPVFRNLFLDPKNRS